MTFFEETIMESGQFSVLPNDILENIVSRLWRSSNLFAFSLACKRMHRFAVPILQFRKPFRTISASFAEGGTRLSICGHPNVEFSHILNRPSLSSCIQEATIYIDNFFADVRNPPLDRQHILPLEDELQMLEPVVQEDLIVREWENSDILLEMLRDHEEEARAVVFLLMLRNLQKIDLYYGQYDEDEWVNWVIRKLVSSHLSRSPDVSYGFLSLREVRVSHTHAPPWDIVSLDLLSPFFLLPSLEKISGFMVCYHECMYGEFKWVGEFGVSSVTEVHFSNCLISGKALGKMLRIPRALNKFSFKNACGLALPGFERLDYIDIIGENYEDNDKVLRVDYDEIRSVTTQTLPALPFSNIDIGDEHIVDEIQRVVVT